MRLLVLVLVGALVGLNPLAHASLPDQVWIAGYYDGDDSDDIVLLALSIKGPQEPPVLPLVTPVAIVLHVLAPSDERGLTSTPLSTFQTRAPPSA